MRKIIEKAALQIATRLKNLAPEHPASIDVLSFALAILINTLSIIGLTLLVSFVTGNTKEAITILITFALLRSVTGGIHLNSGTACVLFTTTLFTTISFIGISNEACIILNLISLILVMIYAPSGIERQSRIKRKYYPLLKVIGISLILMSLLIFDSTLTITFFIQSVLLIRLKGGGKSEEKNQPVVR